MQNLILNRYRPLDVAGKGGYGTVRVAWDTRIQRRVAIKCLRLDTYGTASSPSTPRDIPGLEEARTAAMLSDSHIVGVFDFEIEGPMAYLIMEYMDGITLTELMRMANGPLPLDILTCVFESVAHAIEVAHDNQVLHLDIKPDNVLINRQGQVKVADFGLAQLSHEAGFGKAAGGTIGYMPLEQMRLEAPDVRTDEWALAALTYQMLTGDNPFLAHDLDGAARAIEEAEIVIPSLARGDVGEEVDEAVFGALAIDREDRFASVTLFADAMMPHLGDARRGARQLAAVVGDACADEEEEAEDATEATPSVARVRAGLAERLRGGVGEAVGGIWSAIAYTRNQHPTVFRRRFSQEVRDKALMIFLMGLSVVLVSTFLLCMLEPDASFIQVLMETTSAFATVGLSCGLTGGLSGLSKLVLILTMYIGRLGPLTVATLWIVQGRRNSEILRPEETISVG
mgnify:CR=1 FL=1